LISGLYLPITLPDPKDPNYPAALNAAIATHNMQYAQYLEKILLNNNLSPLAVGKVTIDAGSAAYTCGSGAAAKNAFNNLLLSNTAATTSSLTQTAVSYNGKGILQLVVGVSQSAAGTSTAAGMAVGVFIDGVTVFGANISSAVNRVACAVGQLAVSDSATDQLIALNDSVGLTFNKNVTVAFSSGTNGQGVQVGWRILKLA